MGMYSNFVLAEPSNLTVDLSKVDIDGEFLEIKRVITLEEFGEYMSGWKIYGYPEKCKRYKTIINAIHEQHPTVNFKIHFWYEENRMFYFCWENGACIKYGNTDDCNYFVSNEILLNITGMFKEKKFLVDRYKIEKYAKYLEKINKISKKQVNEETYKTLLYLPMYLKHCPYFRIYNL
jgi:hypothetical protein